MQKLGERLAALRKQYRYKQAEVSAKLNVSQQVISNIECGKTTPDIDFLKKAADLYELSLDQLVGRTFTSNCADDLERQIISHIQQMNMAEKELSLGLVSTVAQHRGNNDGNE